MRKLVCVYDLEPQHRERIAEAAPGFEIVYADGDQAESALASHLAEAEIVAGWSEQAEAHALKAGGALRWVQAWGAGVEQMPFDAFAACEVMLTNASGVHANAISETVLGMMLAFTRKLHLTIRNQMEKQWDWIGGLGEIHGKTIGIVGVGAIGEELARLAQAFQMRVLGVRNSAQPSPFVDAMFSTGGLDRLLQESDFVVVTLPITKETQGLFNRAKFAQMKPSAFFVNIGRGQTVVTDDLVDALERGVIAGAGLDVFDPEPLPESHPLWTMENVILTPHNSGNSIYYTDRAVDILVDNLRSYIESGEPHRNRVSLKNRY
ncbi:D-2-hydroxyacid dehydrogenase [Paenibacillus sp. OV219]|uniref:D-2-hydroxyacid dehydrogenase n=1 Tax=Paenibacillus sp. OV219 TaxID=1884377 RepID=UPI0008C9C070|nr:D-2-hydroxyacid dehydrogenase [Paenibacillus sp. OV219]SEM57516.1 Phosphoglycerate dehydrogenase [Paenibacillus sp. OV219]